MWTLAPFVIRAVENSTATDVNIRSARDNGSFHDGAAREINRLVIRRANEIWLVQTGAKENHVRRAGFEGVGLQWVCEQQQRPALAVRFNTDLAWPVEA